MVGSHVHIPNYSAILQILTFSILWYKQLLCVWWQMWVTFDKCEVHPSLAVGSIPFYTAPVLSIVFRRKSSVLLIRVTFVAPWFFGKNVQNLKKTTMTKDAFICFSINNSKVESVSCQISPFSQLWPVSTHLALEMVCEKSLKKEVNLMTTVKWFFKN